MITAAGIKRVLYTDVENVKSDLKPSDIAALIAGADEVTNIHGETWSLDESEPNIEKHPNQLTGGTYRQDVEPGELTMSFTIGEYDYQTKANLLGGELIKEAEKEAEKVVGWKRARGVSIIEKCLLALTKDGQWVVFPRGHVVTREANTDKAIGLAVTGAALEPTNKEISSEYWFDADEVK